MVLCVTLSSFMWWPRKELIVLCPSLPCPHQACWAVGGREGQYSMPSLLAPPYRGCVLLVVGRACLLGNCDIVLALTPTLIPSHQRHFVMTASIQYVTTCSLWNSEKGKSLRLLWVVFREWPYCWSDIVWCVCESGLPVAQGEKGNLWRQWAVETCASGFLLSSRERLLLGSGNILCRWQTTILLCVVDDSGQMSQAEPS